MFIDGEGWEQERWRAADEPGVLELMTQQIADRRKAEERFVRRWNEDSTTYRFPQTTYRYD